MVTIKNLTTHSVSIISENREILKKYPPQGIVRAERSSMIVGEVDGVPLIKMTFYAPQGLPAHEEKMWLIVSAITASAAKAAGRATDDLITPIDFVRDEHGKILGCRRFALA